MMPTYERRFFLGLLTKENKMRQEHEEEQMNKAKNTNAKGSRTTRVSGDALKSKLKSGEIPNK